MAKPCPHCTRPMSQRYTKSGAKRGWNCAHCANERAKAHRVDNPEQYLDAKLWTFYRIRLADYRRMFDEQGGRCAGCGAEAVEGEGFAGLGFVVDHDHACCPSTRSTGGGGGKICGKCVCGLICNGCNVAMGMVGDDADRLERLAGYARRTRAHDGPNPARCATSARPSDIASCT